MRMRMSKVHRLQLKALISPLGTTSQSMQLGKHLSGQACTWFASSMSVKPCSVVRSTPRTCTARITFNHAGFLDPGC